MEGGPGRARAGAAAAARPGQALREALPSPSEEVSYKEKEKAFLIRVLFPLLLWASRRADAFGLAALSLRLDPPRVRVSGALPSPAAWPARRRAPWGERVSLPSQPARASTL